MKFIALALALTLGAAAQAQTGTCRDIDLSGNYSISGMGIELTLKQNGCDLVVTDLTNKAVWTFDLSGSREARAPERIALAQNNSDGGIEAVRSLRIRTASAPQYNGEVEPTAINTTLSFVQPRVRSRVGTILNLGVQIQMKFAADVGQRGYLNGRPTHRVPLEARALRVEDLRVTFVSVGGTETGVIKSAFLRGANFAAELASPLIMSSLNRFTAIIRRQ